VTAEIIVAFFLTPFIVHSLGSTIYGIWSLLNSLVGHLGLIDLGIRGSVGRYINHYLARDDKDRVNEVITTSMLILTVVSLLIGGVAHIIAHNFDRIFPKTPVELLDSIVLVLPLMAINLWVTILTTVFRGVIVALDRFDVNNAINIAVLILRTISVIFVLRLGYGFIGLAFVVLGANFIGAIMVITVAFVLYKPLRISARHASLERLAEMWKFGIITFVTRSANQIIYQIDSSVVMIFFGPQMVTVYSIAGMLLQNGQRLVEQIGGVLYPSIMKSGSLKDLEGLRSLFIRQARLAFYFGTAVFLGFVVFGRQFIDLWMGPGYESAAIILAILSISELMSLFTSGGGTVLFSLDKLRFNLFSSILEAIANLILTLLFVKFWGMDVSGVALGTLVSMIAIRGIIHPVYTTGQLGLRFGSYMKQIGSKVGLLIVFSLVLFVSIASLEFTSTWFSFFGQVSVAVVVYFFVASIIMFKRITLHPFLNTSR